MWEASANLPSVGDVGELKLAANIRRRFGTKGPGTSLGIGDDGAIVRIGAKQVVISADMLIEDIDFRRRWALPRDVGAKAAAANLSDLAAMGAKPRALFVSLAIEKFIAARAVMSLLGAVHQTGARFGAPLLGGDLSGTAGPIIVSVTVLGELEGPGLRREKGRLDDIVLVTGTLGGAALALHALENNKKAPPSILARQLRPTPQIAVARALYGAGLVRSAIDISDGLVKDATALATKSLGVVLETERLPIAPQVRRLAGLWKLDMTRLALTGGEDFELAVAVAPRHVAEATRIAGRLGVSLTAVGRISETRGLYLQGPDQTQVADTGLAFNHFRS